MKKILVDFNNRESIDDVIIDDEDGLILGERVVLYDGEMEVMATIINGVHFRIIARIDRSTIIDL